MAMPPSLKIITSEKAYANILRKAHWSDGVKSIYCKSSKASEELPQGLSKIQMQGMLENLQRQNENLPCLQTPLL